MAASERLTHERSWHAFFWLNVRNMAHNAWKVGLRAVSEAECLRLQSKNVSKIPGVSPGHRTTVKWDISASGHVETLDLDLFLCNKTFPTSIKKSAYAQSCTSQLESWACQPCAKDQTTTNTRYCWSNGRWAEWREHSRSDARLEMVQCLVEVESLTQQWCERRLNTTTLRIQSRKRMTKYQTSGMRTWINDDLRRRHSRAQTDISSHVYARSGGQLDKALMPSDAHRADVDDARDSWRETIWLTNNCFRNTWGPRRYCWRWTHEEVEAHTDHFVDLQDRPCLSFQHSDKFLGETCRWRKWWDPRWSFQKRHWPWTACLHHLAATLVFGMFCILSRFDASVHDTDP